MLDHAHLIPFNRIAYFGDEMDYIEEALKSGWLAGDGSYSKQVESILCELVGCRRALLTPSCTAALEMSALLLEIGPGDDVIMPSYTFVSTANAFAIRGARIRFVDVRPDTMNIDEKQIENAITRNTKAIVVVHYAGVACELDSIAAISDKRGVVLIEDAAQGIQSTYRGRHVGSRGALATFSFHETKNITSGGEGGLLAINDESLIERAEIIREKGTDRSKFLQGIVNKYSWVDIGSSYLPGELQAAHLRCQFSHAQEILERRRSLWALYREELADLEREGYVQLPQPPEWCTHNGHLFYVKCANNAERGALISHLSGHGIVAPFHYLPLHSSPAGKRFGEFVGEDRYTTRDSERLFRLPLFFDLGERNVRMICDIIRQWFRA